MRILILEPYYGGSHRFFVDVLESRSRHEITSHTLPARYWKWRLSGAPFLFAERFAKLEPKPDLLFFNNTIDLAAFVALVGPQAAALPKIIYFHENQISYPLSEDDTADAHYGLINITSAAGADRAWFNSDYHLQSFLGSIDPFLDQFPDFVPLGLSEKIRQRSSVFPLPVESLPDVPLAKEKGKALRILWNHRWEYDKAPDVFFEAMERIMIEGMDFELVVLGEGFRTRPLIFDRAREKLGDKVIRYGFAENRNDYASWVRSCDVVISTARQENFGISIAEAVQAGCFPLLPDRLVYPEFIPISRHRYHLYRDDLELVAMLRKASQNLEALRSGEKFDYYDQYRARLVVDRFDKEVELLAASR